MKLEHEFDVPVPVDEAWRVLLDVERITPCLPGATLLSVDGRDFTGSVKVKVGPITVTYNGKATFSELDEAGHRAVIEATGKESRGAGTAAATVTATLVETGTSTSVRVETDLNVTGRPAQFGRGVLEEVGAKLVGQFAACLADELANAAHPPPPPAPPAKKVAPAKKAAPAAKKAAPPAKKTAAAAKKTAPAAKKAAPPPPPSAPSPPRPPTPLRPPAEPIDLMEVAGASVAKRVIPIVAALVLLLGALRRRRRRNR